MDDPFDLPPDVLRRIPLFAELAKVLSWSGGPVNWDMARQIATSVAAGETAPPTPSEADHAEVAENVRLAEMWLAEASGLPQPSTLVKASAAAPQGWADHACTALAELVDPVAAKIASAMSANATEIGADQAMLSQALGQVAPAFTGMQAGSTIGAIAAEVTGIHDLGVPGPDAEIVLVPLAIDRIADGYGLERAPVRQVVALRAAAHRLSWEGFARARFFSLYHSFVSSLSFNFGDALRKIQELDLSDPSGMHDALGDEALFSDEPSAESAAASETIGILLSIVSAQVDEAVRSAGTRIGPIDGILEALARQETGAGNEMLSRLLNVGMQPAPAGGSFVRSILGRGGWEALNSMWEMPDAFPTRPELDDPDAWHRRINA